LGLRTVAKSEVAERFAGWNQFGGFVWSRILLLRTEFADRCDWAKLKQLAWRQLLMRQPQFAENAISGKGCVLSAVPLA
jgi:hypothetical protein